MESIWMGIAPSPTSTRVLAMDGAHDTFLKARLARSPIHRHALSTLLEAIALWQGRRVRGRPARWVRFVFLSRDVSRRRKRALLPRLDPRSRPRPPRPP